MALPARRRRLWRTSREHNLSRRSHYPERRDEPPRASDNTLHGHVHRKSIVRLRWRLRRWRPRLRIRYVVRLRHRLLRLRTASTAPPPTAWPVHEHMQLVLRCRLRRWRPRLRVRCVVPVRLRLLRLRTASTAAAAFTFPPRRVLDSLHERVHRNAYIRLGWRLRRWRPRLRVRYVVHVRHRLLRLRAASTAAAAATACAPVHQWAAPRPGACVRSLWEYDARPDPGARVCARAYPSTRFRRKCVARWARGV
jgi:hypothetical protein